MSKFYLKLNIGRLISVSTFLILFLSLVILGKSVHALQLAGIISSTKLFAFSLPVIGLYGTIESIVGQILLLLLIGGWVMKSKQKSK